MTNPGERPAPASHTDLAPLYVDLDGSLVASDTLWESVCRLARSRPAQLLLLPAWLLKGRACLKARLAELVDLEVEHLPYRPAALAHVRSAREQGRRVVLATASNAGPAHAIARHLDLFDAVLASDGRRNLKGTAKLAAIRADAAGRGFAYLGDSRADLPIWLASAEAILAVPQPGAERRIAAAGIPHARLDGHHRVGMRPLLRALRPHQWSKNALVFVPLILAHQLADLARLRAVLVAFACFCAVASANYLLNDLLDLDADRRHARKRRRPIATGELSIPAALLASGLLLSVAGAAAGIAVGAGFSAMLAGYFILTCAYSLWLKQQLILDVLVLAGLYAHRVLSGGVAAEVSVSPWLLAFSTFFFFSLALVKRDVELRAAREDDRRQLRRRAYQVEDIGLIEIMGVSSGYISVLVLCLFVSSNDVSRLYANPELLWLMCPIMLYWITRVWLLARRGGLDEDPVLFATTDRVSYIAGFLIAGLLVLATW